MKPPGWTGLRACLALFAAAAGLRAGEPDFAPYQSVKPILRTYRAQLPAQLRNTDERQWQAWSRDQDQAIRARLAQGDLDSMVNFLLLGASFTRQPRIRMESLTEASKAGVLRARVDDLVTGLRHPGANERLIFLQTLLRNQGMDPNDPRKAGQFILKNLLRVVEERRNLAQQSAGAQGPARSSLFRDRGLSLDTGIFPSFSIDETLRDLKQRGLLRPGQVARVAIIGPGLDFIDKNEDSAYDYYPPQTLQPFALYDSLLRLGLANQAGISVSVLDISPRVIEHLRRARQRAAKKSGYVIQLPRDKTLPMPPALAAYWSSLGNRIGTATAPLPPPQVFPSLETRAVQIRPDVVLACQPVDLDIILERLNLAPQDRFDLIVATNIFVYYDAFQQSLALENVAAMLKPAGLLLSNDRLPDLPASSMQSAGATVLPIDLPSAPGREAVSWYRTR